MDEKEVLALADRIAPMFPPGDADCQDMLDAATAIRSYAALLSARGKVMEAVQDEAVAAFMRHYYDNKSSVRHALRNVCEQSPRSLRSLLSG